MGARQPLPRYLPAADCFLLLKEIYRVPDARYRETLDYLTQVLDVGDELNIQIRRLSLGERMKMELIAALLHTPRVVYLDEPTIGLDLTAQRAIRDFILQYREKHRPAMLLTSHYMEDIERLCKRILIIREGEIVFDGLLDEVKRLYADTKVITAHLHRGDGTPKPTAQIRSYGEVVSFDEGSVVLRVPRTDTAAAAACLLDTYSVADLAIEEMDIGTIIERIMVHRGEGLA
jgi:ABC-2 type transport system ATP-binding protein